MKMNSHLTRRDQIFLAFVLLASIVAIWLAPEERTLGAGIKPVYVHVALTWAGMLGYYLSAALGIVSLLSNRPPVFDWLKVIYRVAFLMHLAGLLLSILASYVNWGGFPLREPRAISSLSVVVLGFVVGWIMNAWTQPRLGILAVVPSAFLIWTVESSRMVLHPEDPVMAAPQGIKYAFLSMFALSFLLSVWGVAYLRRGQVD